MNDLQTTVSRVTNPVGVVIEQVVATSKNRKMGLLVDAVMGQLPPLPAWALPLCRIGVQKGVKDELKRRGFVYRDGRYFRFADLSLREAWSYVRHLEDSVALDRARIRRLKDELSQAEKVAGSLDSPRSIGDLLGWKEAERIA